MQQWRGRKGVAEAVAIRETKVATASAAVLVGVVVVGIVVVVVGVVETNGCCSAGAKDKRAQKRVGGYVAVVVAIVVVVGLAG